MSDETSKVVDEPTAEPQGGAPADETSAQSPSQSEPETPSAAEAAAIETTGRRNASGGISEFRAGRERFVGT